MSVMDLYHKIMDKYREPIAYVFFGGLTTIVSWLTYALFVWIFNAAGYTGFDIFGFHIDQLNISNVLSWVCGVSFAFVVNKWFVFLSKSLAPKVVLRELGEFFAARIFTGVIAIILFPILYNLGLNQCFLGTDGFLAKILTSILEIVLNWIFSKYLIFKKDEKNEE